MAIIWLDRMSVGNNLIDHDHHFLINFTNTIELLLQTSEDNNLLLEAFNQFHDYAKGHFRREEAIQRKVEFPGSVYHRSQHKVLINQLEDIRNLIQDANSKEKMLKKTPEIIEFLRNWLINHIIIEDLQLKPFLEKHSKDFT